jgi:hypothetical protein
MSGTPERGVIGHHRPIEQLHERAVVRSSYVACARNAVSALVTGSKPGPPWHADSFRLVCIGFVRWCAQRSARHSIHVGACTCQQSTEEYADTDMRGLGAAYAR